MRSTTRITSFQYLEPGDDKMADGFWRWWFANRVKSRVYNPGISKKDQNWASYLSIKVFKDSSILVVFVGLSEPPFSRKGDCGIVESLDLEYISTNELWDRHIAYLVKTEYPRSVCLLMIFIVVQRVVFNCAYTFYVNL